jgi:hypothetical protein
MHDEHHHEGKEPFYQYWNRVFFFAIGLLFAWFVLIFYFVMLLCVYRRSSTEKIAKVSMNDSRNSDHLN